MAWQAYVDGISAAKPGSRSVICAVDGAIWAVSPGWAVTQSELAKVVKASTSKDGPETASAHVNGLFLAGQKFTVVRFEDNEIWKGASKNPEECACAYVANRCAIVAVCPGGRSVSGELNTIVQKNHDYLKQNGY